jgi:hypothetical protein
MKKIKTMLSQAKHDGCLHTSRKRSSHAHVDRIPIVVSLGCVQISATRYRAALILNMLLSCSFRGTTDEMKSVCAGIIDLIVSALVERIVMLLLCFHLRLLLDS